MSPTLSIIVCTYNRSDWLRGCLSSLEPHCDDNTVEVLVIDNNSSDATPDIVQQFTDRLPNYTYIFEGKQGLSYARNRGFHEARGQVVAYLDDDTRVCPDWVRAVIQFFQSHPDASGVGGQYKAFSVVPIPDWFPKEYGSRTLGDETRLLQKGEWIPGTNMAFRKKALVDIGGFDVSIGMKGDKVSYGEETQLILRMTNSGMKIYYCSNMCVEHAILPHKLTLRWLLRASFSNGYDGVKTFHYKGSAINFVPRLLRSFRQAIFILIRSDEKYFKTRIYRSMKRLLWHIGFFTKLIGF